MLSKNKILIGLGVYASVGMCWLSGLYVYTNTTDDDNALSKFNNDIGETTEVNSTETFTLSATLNTFDEIKQEPILKQANPTEDVVQPVMSNMIPTSSQNNHLQVQEIISDNYQTMNAIVTFYTGLGVENGGYTEMNAIGGSLEVGSLAAPKDLPFGTSVIIPNLPTDINTSLFVVDDRGGAIQRISQDTVKLDVYVPRMEDESDGEYYTRVNHLGIIHTPILYYVPNDDIDKTSNFHELLKNIESNTSNNIINFDELLPSDF
ncbi:hypothetical protein AN639_05195 [Candidatus Epulonipiscium fishelsonii]|uniref:Uncharacterized protein n=1 Tax=Candidatus Epulonipiscium fishelsonii TaxID=77094 RepID=A0ACC8XAG5_9FIRM|nr:hypothetical protein AN396_08090 [Epulopiscium sp. SCG-B11WGA-EpuloA1]ONI40101.1 hypothetical protein AN639_05195 [Epulopiscium sp. SCG-B05WGA-EpuloA1]